MVWGEGFELDASEGELDVYPDYGLVALEGPLPYGDSYGVREPAVEELPHLQVLGVEQEPTVGIGACRTELTAGVFFALARDISPLAVRLDVCSAVADDPAFPVLAWPEDLPIAVRPALGARHLLLSFHQVVGLDA